MSLLGQIRGLIAGYKDAYGRAPTHITLNPDEEQRLRNETGFVGSLHGQKIDGAEIRVSANAPSGIHHLPPTGGAQ